MSVDRYMHSAGKDYKVARCIACNQEMFFVYSHVARDTCHECGGRALNVTPQKKKKGREHEDKNRW